MNVMMTISRFLKFFILVFCVFVMADHADAQVRKRTTSTTSKNKKSVKNKMEITPPFSEKLTGDLLFGNLGFFNGLSISSKANVGYKLHERFSAGGGMRLFYDQFSVQGPDPSILDLGGFVYGRGKITNEIYVQAEYAFMNYSKDPDGFLPFRGIIENEAINFPLIGAGYMSGGDKWKFGIQLMFNTNERARDLQRSIIEYWFGASYNF
jgi:hypothetical protein